MTTVVEGEYLLPPVLASACVVLDFHSTRAVLAGSWDLVSRVIKYLNWRYK